MAVKPVLFSVDDDPSVLSAISRDLRKRYGEHYRIMRADSGATALEALRQLRLRDDPVALFVADQRMPQMSGTEFLAQTRALYPDARRVLLTAYADTEAAIQAINAASVHHYLLKPWDPPEEALYPVLDDLLDDWQSGYSPPFEGLRIIDHRWSPEAHEIKEFLARNHVPYIALDIIADPEAQKRLDALGVSKPKLPFIILPDGKTLEAPTITVLGEHVGLKTQATQPFYDLVIVGSGPAGLAAAVYAASEGLRAVVIEREAPGGQAGMSSRIENYLGFPSGLSGGELARRAVAQAKRFGVEFLTPQEAVGLRIEGPYRFVQLADGTEIACHVVVIAVGLSYRKLVVPGMETLSGAGVYYGAALSEVLGCRDQPAFVIGAANSAGQGAMYLAQFASKVFMLVRGPALEEKMSQYLVDRINVHPNIEVRVHTNITAVHGEGHLEAVSFRSSATGVEERLPAAATFVFIGAEPCTSWLRGVLALDEHGFVLAGPQLRERGALPKDWPKDREPFLPETSVPGVFVVGDVRADSVKRVASAVGEGSIAVQFIHRYIAKVR